MEARILYLDDDNLTATMVTKTLMGEGYHTVVAENGHAGLQFFKEQKFDLVLCDFAMPGMDGFGVLKAMREIGSIPAFVFLTGKGDETVAVKALKSGAIDYVVKDKEGRYLQTLPIVIDRALDRKQREQSQTRALQSLQESEERYRDVFDTNPAIQLLVNPEDGSVFDCNTAATEYYGYSKSELLSMSVFDINCLPEEQLKEKLSQISSREKLHHQVQHKLQSGAIRDVEIFTGPVTIGGKPYNHVIIHDITDLLAAQVRMSASETKFRQIFERTRDGLCIVRTDGFIEEWNIGAEKITTLSASEVTGRHIVEVLFHEHAGLTTENLKDDFVSDLGQVASGTSEYIERESEIFFASDGTVRYLDLSIFPIESSEEFRICVIMHNVTEQVRSNQEISAREHKFRTLFESIADAVFILDQKTGTLIEANRSACDLYSYAHADIVGKHILGLSAEPERTTQALHLLSEYIPLRYHKRHTGEIFPAEITTRAVRMQDRDVLVCTVRDISERIGLQEELERSVALMEVVNDAVVDAILVTDADNTILSFNKRFIQNWNIPEPNKFLPGDEANIAAIFQSPPDMERICHSLLAVVEAQSESYGIVEIQPGQEFEVHASPFFVRDRAAGRVWSFRNLTQRKHAEEQLQVSQARLRAIFENAAVGIALINRQGGFVQFNEQLTTMLGYSEAELKALRAEEISYGEDRELSLERIRTLFENGHEGYRIEKRFVRKNGAIFWADLSVKPIINQANKVEAAICVLADISDKKRFENELQRINRDLQSRNEELNAFAHSVAHDLKNPVSVIKGLAGLLESDLYAYEPDELYEIIHRMKSAGESMECIIDALMLLSRVRDERIDITSVDMQGAADEALAQLRQQIDDTNAVVAIPGELPTCLGYAPWVQRVWTNYLSNAMKYSGSNPRIRIYAEMHHPGEITYYVEDNGPGISTDAIDRLFTPYQRLTQTAQGHGLGLSIVKRIIERLNGSVGVTNGENGGALFYFMLPAAEPKV